MFTILGSGFGLYGYLPALLSFEEYEVVLPIRYKEFIEGRKELNKYLDKVNWKEDQHQCLETASKVIIARNPVEQEKNVNNIINNFYNFDHIFLEKPVSSNPNDSLILIKNLSYRPIKLHINYIFFHLKWFSELEKKLLKETEITIIWNFKASHFQKKIDSWKMYNSQGGGVIRFYGIHIIASLYKLRFTNLIYSICNNINKDKDVPVQWKASFKNEKNYKINILINIISNETNFIIRSPDETLYDLSTPFDMEKKYNLLDDRVSILQKVLKDLNNNGYKKSNTLFYEGIQRFWNLIEDNTLYD